MDEVAQIHKAIHDYLTDQNVDHMLYEVGVTVLRGDKTWFITALSVPWAAGFLHLLSVRDFEVMAEPPPFCKKGWFLGDPVELTEGTTTVAFVVEEDEDPFGNYDPFSAREPRHEYMIDFEDPDLLPKVLKVVGGRGSRVTSGIWNWFWGGGRFKSR